VFLPHSDLLISDCILGVIVELLVVVMFILVLAILFNIFSFLVSMSIIFCHLSVTSALIIIMI
jgi:hypothetical protein